MSRRRTRARTAAEADRLDVRAVLAARGPATLDDLARWTRVSRDLVAVALKRLLAERVVRRDRSGSFALVGHREETT